VHRFFLMIYCSNKVVTLKWLIKSITEFPTNMQYHSGFSDLPIIQMINLLPHYPLSLINYYFAAVSAYSMTFLYANFESSITCTNGSWSASHSTLCDKCC